MKKYLSLTWLTRLAITLLLVFTAFHLSAHFSAQTPFAPISLASLAQANDEAAQQYTCGMHPMIITDEPGQCPICGMDLTPLKASGDSTSSVSNGERKIKYWVAPMDPSYIRDEPGKSPMGMDLVPVYEDEAASGSIITVDPVTSQNMGVRIGSVERKNLSRTIRTVGLVGYDEPEQYAVNSKIEGWVERLYVNETGQFVKKGARLLDIYSPALVSAQEEFLLALDNSLSLQNSPFPSIAEGAQRLLEASRRRLLLWDISSQQIKQLESTRKVSKVMTLFAPQDGIVTTKMVREGQFVKSGMELFMLSDISKVWVFADIYEYEMPWIRVGQKAKIYLPFVGSEPIKSEISFIYPYVEPKTRTVKARFEIDNPDFLLKPDMYVNVRINSDPVKNVLSVPAEAVLYSGEVQTVFVALGNGKFEPRKVKTGLQSDNGDIEIKQGLLEGEQVVVSAQFMLDSESKLREAIQKMLEPKNAPLQETSHSDDDLDSLFEQDDQESLERLFE